MSQDLKSRLETWAERGEPVGVTALLERVEQDLTSLEATPEAIPTAQAQRRPAWAIAAIAVVFAALAIGFVPWLLRSPEGGSTTQSPTSSVPVATTNLPASTSLPGTTVPVTPTTATATTTSIAPPPPPIDPVTVPNLQDRDGPPSVETFKSFFGLELDYIIKYVDEPPPAEDAEIAYQDPPPGAVVEAGSVVTVYLFQGVAQGFINAPGRPMTGTWTTYLPADGLASDCVAALDVSPDGTVWAGCVGGISAFDGSAWTTVDSSLEIIDLVVDEDANVWVAAFKEPDLAEIRRLSDGTWTTFDGDVFDLAAGPGGTVAAGPSSPLAFFDGSSWGKIDGGEGTWVAVDPGGVVWASGNETGLLRYDGDWTMHSRPNWMSADQAGGLPALGTEEIWAAPGGDLWAVTGGISRYDGVEWATFLEGAGITDVAFGAAGEVWAVSSLLGVYSFDGSQWAHYDATAGLPSTALSSVAIDPDGTVWLGTASDGIIRFTIDR